MDDRIATQLAAQNNQLDRWLQIRCDHVEYLISSEIQHFQYDAMGWSLSAIVQTLFQALKQCSKTDPITYREVALLSVAAAYCHYCEYYRDIISKSNDNRDIRPEFLQQIDPGHILAEICHDAVAVFDRDELKNYQIACILIHILLQGPFCPLRRGSWYIRLCIDYSHLSRDSEIPAILIAALNDPKVKMGDRMNLIKRYYSKSMAHISASASPGVGVALDPPVDRSLLMASVFRSASISVNSSEDKRTYKTLLEQLLVVTDQQIIAAKVTVSNQGAEKAGQSSSLVASKAGRFLAISAKAMTVPWSCSICTFINDSVKPCCDMCTSPRAQINTETIMSPLGDMGVVDLSADSEDDTVFKVNNSYSEEQSPAEVIDSTNRKKKRKTPLNGGRNSRTKVNANASNDEQMHGDTYVLDKDVAGSTGTVSLSLLVSEMKDTGTSDSIEDYETLSEKDIERLQLHSFLQSQPPGKPDDVVTSDSATVRAWRPTNIMVTGKRFGDPKRKGKSMFCGSSRSSIVFTRNNGSILISFLYPCI